ncbi:MAG: helix-turn-helix domain-containing protein [Candidatus Methylomirabilales bacterium]
MPFPTANNSQYSTGLLLKCARIVQGRSLTEVAQQISVSPSYLSRIETGQRRLTPEIAARLSRALSVRQGPEAR